MLFFILDLTGELKNKVDNIWDSFWAGGISNPMEVLEQLTYLLFIKRLDDLQTLEEKKANRIGKSIEKRIFPEGEYDESHSWDDLRWSRFKQKNPDEIYLIMSKKVFPFLQKLGSEGSTYAENMKDARFTIPTAALLSKVIDLIDEIPMSTRDTKGDIYEYMLNKLGTAGANGQFRTPRHIIQLMIEMTVPTAKDIICDPACGTAGFLVQAGEYLRKSDKTLLTDQAKKKHYNNSLFNGFDFDSTMLRIGSMNMLLHGVENPNIRYRESLSDEFSDAQDRYSLILANPPFAGSLDYGQTSQKLKAVVKTKKTELLFMALFLQLLKPGGRAAVIVPEGVLSNSSKAHIKIRSTIVNDHFLEGVVALPSGIFEPYSGVSTAILLFTKTGKGGTDKVWFYDLQADGFSLDKKRSPLFNSEELLLTKNSDFKEIAHSNNNLPDCLKRWTHRTGSERKRSKIDQSFCICKKEIIDNGYDLSINRYKENTYKKVQHRPPIEILKDIKKIEYEIFKGIENLEKMFK